MNCTSKKERSDTNQVTKKRHEKRQDVSPANQVTGQDQATSSLVSGRFGHHPLEGHHGRLVEDHVLADGLVHLQAQEREELLRSPSTTLKAKVEREFKQTMGKLGPQFSKGKKNCPSSATNSTKNKVQVKSNIVQ